MNINNPVQISFNPVPISLDMLNSSLSKCKKQNDILKHCSVVKAQVNRITLKVFIQTIEALVKSYHDVNHKNWNSFVKNVDRLFPKEGKDTSYDQFKQDINYFLENNKYLIKFGDQSGNKATEEDFLKNKLKNLNDAAAVCNQSNLKRLNNVYFSKPPSITNRARASNLHLMMNCLLLEEDFLERIDQYLTTLFSKIELLNIQKKYASRTIYLKDDSPLMLFEIPKAQVDELRSDFVSFYSEDEKTFVSLQHKIFKKGRNDNLKIKNLFEDLRLKLTQEGVQQFFDSSLYSIEMSEKIDSSDQLLEDLKKLIVKHKKFPWRIEGKLMYDVAPFLCLLQIDMEGHSESMHPDLLYKSITQSNEFVDLWKVHRNGQKEFFDFLSHELFKLVQQSPQEMKEFTTDLTGKASAQGFLRPFPGESGGIDWENLVKSDKAPEHIDKAPEHIDWIDPHLKKWLEVSNQPPLPKKKTKISFSKTVTEQVSLEPAGSEKIEQILPLIPLPGEPFPFRYDFRVQRWDEHCFGNTLPEKIFPSFFNLPTARQKFHHMTHAPHKLADRLAKTFGMITTGEDSRGNKHMNIVLSAAIKSQEWSSRGSIVYAINTKTNTCFHRQFTAKSSLYEIKSSKLSAKSTYSTPQYIKEYNSEISYNDQGNVKIKDYDRNLFIKLFKV